MLFAPGLVQFAFPLLHPLHPPYLWMQHRDSQGARLACALPRRLQTH